MHRPFITAAATGALLALGACARRAPGVATGSRTSALSLAAAACADGAPTADTPPADTPAADVTAWRRVAADGFTFCLPTDWQVDGRQASRGSATLQWGTGEHPRSEVRTVTRVVPAAAVGNRSPRPPDAQVRRAPEVIGGRRADVWRNRFGATYYTGGQWDAPRVWLVGEASTPQDADAEVAVIRTVRFLAP